MKNLIVRRLTIADEAAFMEATALWDFSSGFSWTKPADGQSFADFVDEIECQERGQRLPSGYVPATLLYGFIGGKIVGRVNLRHRLNDFLRQIAGHIGYGVVPAYRRQGIATALLAATLPECRRIGIEKALVTCDDDNIPSAKVIEKNGGVLENIFDPGGDQKPKRRYWIDL